MTIHPLRREYADYVRRRYGRYVNGNPNPGRTEAVAQKVVALGIDYATYIEISMSLWCRWAKSKGWEYPYWNAVTSDGTIDRVRNTIGALDSVLDLGTDNTTEFSHELAYVLDYIDWYVGGRKGQEPERSASVSVEVQVGAAEYVCMVYGVRFVTSELDVIAREVADKMAGEP